MSIASPTRLSPAASLRPAPLEPIAIAPKLDEASAAVPGRSDFEKRRIAQRMLDLWHHLHESPAAPATLRELSRLSGYSPCHVQRLFKRLFGVAPHAVALRLKLESAAELLWASDEPIDAICRRTGFAHRSSFSRLFKHTYGLSPTDYRAVRDGAHRVPYRDAATARASSTVVGL